MPIERVTDIACIDLIERKRLGHAIRVEDFLSDVLEFARIRQRYSIWSMQKFASRRSWDKRST
jgi:hypothetical protein